jgi:hypothetical protein
MKINFRVVGIFCHLKDFDIGEFVLPPTVREAMEVIRTTSGSGFTFVADDEANPNIPLDKASLTSASFFVDKPFTSPTGNKYPADVYSLSDNVDKASGVLQVFQYYILRPLEKPNQFETISVGNKFISFGTSERLRDGDSVVWRQVSIKLPRYQMEGNEQYKRMQEVGIA